MSANLKLLPSGLGLSVLKYQTPVSLPNLLVLTRTICFRPVFSCEKWILIVASVCWWFVTGTSLVGANEAQADNCFVPQLLSQIPEWEFGLCHSWQGFDCCFFASLHHTHLSWLQHWPETRPSRPQFLFESFFFSQHPHNHIHLGILGQMAFLEKMWCLIPDSDRRPADSGICLLSNGQGEPSPTTSFASCASHFQMEACC